MIKERRSLVDNLANFKEKLHCIQMYGHDIYLKNYYKTLITNQHKKKSMVVSKSKTNLTATHSLNFLLTKTKRPRINTWWEQ